MLKRTAGRLTSIAQLLKHFAARQKLFFIPLLIVLLLASLLLLVTSGLSNVAPFVYALF
ncbi:MAG: hypothetical protein RL701_5105 [Pseudomonadota bacterium]